MGFLLTYGIPLSIIITPPQRIVSLGRRPERGVSFMGLFSLSMHESMASHTVSVQSTQIFLEKKFCCETAEIC